MSQHHERLSARPWRRVRAQVLDRAGGLCEIRTPSVCTGFATEVDHIVPLSRGGHPLDVENLRAACKACNLDRNAKSPKVVNPWGL